MTEPLDLTKLKAVADAATQGEWRGFEKNPCDEYWAEHTPADAEYIATFAPPMVKRLLERVRELERERDSALKWSHQYEAWLGIANRYTNSAGLCPGGCKLQTPDGTTCLRCRVRKLEAQTVEDHNTIYRLRGGMLPC